MSGRALRLDDRSFRFLVVGAGLCWAVAFPVIALFNQLELYGDGPAQACSNDQKAERAVIEA